MIDPVLTIVTAAHRNPAGLRLLAADLAPILGSRISWRIKDSGACAETAAWAASAIHEHCCFDNAPDSGIYDALNQAIAGVTTEYYLVVGSDDRVHGNALMSVVDHLVADPEERADILTYPVETIRGPCKRRRRPLWISSSSLMSSHSVGTLIRRSLHETVGSYDTRYRILADSQFIRTAYQKGASFKHHGAPVLGMFGLDGVSNRDHGRRLVETYSYMVASGSPMWLQAILLCVRMFRYRTKSLL